MLGGCAGEVEETDLDLEYTGLEFYMYRLVVVSSSPGPGFFPVEIEFAKCLARSSCTYGR